MSEDRRCHSCRFWHREYPTLGVGDCIRIQRDSRDVAFVVPSSAKLFTKAGFYCPLWRAKEKAGGDEAAGA